MKEALVAYPAAERVAIHAVGARYAGVSFFFDVAQQEAEPFLPLVSAGVPVPTCQLLEPTFTLRFKSALGVERALTCDP